MAPGGSASGIGHGVVGVRSSCLREGHVLTFVVVCRRGESFLDIVFSRPPFSLCRVAPCYKFGTYLDTVFIRRHAGCLS